MDLSSTLVFKACISLCISGTLVSHSASGRATLTSLCISIARWSLKLASHSGLCCTLVSRNPASHTSATLPYPPPSPHSGTSSIHTHPRSMERQSLYTMYTSAILIYERKPIVERCSLRFPEKKKKKQHWKTFS